MFMKSNDSSFFVQGWEQQVGKECRSQIWRSQYKAVGVLFGVHPLKYTIHLALHLKKSFFSFSFLSFSSMGEYIFS